MRTANEYLGVGFALAVVGSVLAVLVGRAADSSAVTLSILGLTALVAGTMLTIGVVAKGVEVGSRTGTHV